MCGIYLFMFAHMDLQIEFNLQTQYQLETFRPEREIQIQIPLFFRKPFA